MNTVFEQSAFTREVLKFRCPRWKELPVLELYMDQMTGYIADVFGPLLDSEDKERPLTKAMVNNYVKAGMIPRPEKKKYRREHLAYLIIYCAMKQVLSLPEARAILQMARAENTLPQIYDFFCQEVENALAETWGQPQEKAECSLSGESRELMIRFARSCANKVYLQKRIAFEEKAVLRPKK